MTAIYSIVYDDSIQIMTDGAAYHRGVLRKVVKKAHGAQTMPFAISGRGNAYMVQNIAKHVVDVCDQTGSVDTAFRLLKVMAERVKKNAAKLGNNHFEIYAHGLSETEGFCQKGFTTHHQSGPIPFELVQFDRELVGAPDLTLAQQALFAGEKPRLDTSFLRRRGVEMFELMRLDTSDKQIKFEEGPQEWSVVGGHCILTTITREGVTSETLKVWNDPLGEKINPYRGLGNVHVFENRKQRRAAKQAERTARVKAG